MIWSLFKFWRKARSDGGTTEPSTRSAGAQARENRPALQRIGKTHCPWTPGESERVLPGMRTEDLLARVAEIRADPPAFATDEEFEWLHIEDELARRGLRKGDK